MLVGHIEHVRVRFIRRKPIDAQEAILSHEEVLLKIAFESEQVTMHLENALGDCKLELVTRYGIGVLVINLDAIELFLQDCLLNLPIIIFGGVGNIAVTLLRLFHVLLFVLLASSKLMDALTGIERVLVDLYAIFGDCLLAGVFRVLVLVKNIHHAANDAGQKV